MAAIFALAAGPAIRTGVHVRITMLTDILPRRPAGWVDVVATLTALIVATLLVYALWIKVGQSIDRDIVATTVTQTPLWIPQLFVLWGFTQLWLDLLARLIRRARNQCFEWRGMDGEPADV